MTHWLSSLANGRVILSLEGGYNINSISHAMTMCTKALLGDPLPMLEPGQVPCNSAINSINNVLKAHKKFWPNLQYGMSLPKEKLLPRLKVISKRESSKRDKRLEERGRNVEKPKQTESKIALEGIESEKLELSLAIDKNCLNLVTDEEILKLKNEVENIKIKNSEIGMVVKSDVDEAKRNVVPKKNEAKNPDGNYQIHSV